MGSMRSAMSWARRRGVSWATAAAVVASCITAPSQALAAGAYAKLDDAKFAVVAVAGDDVNLRSGPSIDHHAVGQLSKGHLLFEVGRDGEFVRVRVPGGVPVYVFGGLLEWDADDGEQGALRCRVTAEDVLIRATPTTAHYPLHDQKLQRDEELVVLGVEETAKGRWLRVVTPPLVHVWIHERYVRPADPAPSAKDMRRAAETRLDDLTGGRTRVERERRAAAALADFETRLTAISDRVDGGACDEALETAARELANDAGTMALRVRALALAERIVGLREKLVADAAKAQADAEEREREEARRRAQEADEARRRREAEIEAERLRKRRARGTPAATGVIRARAGTAWIELSGGAVIDLTSHKFQLADYGDRSVRVWGHREQRAGRRDRIEVTSIEILTDD